MFLVEFSNTAHKLQLLALIFMTHLLTAIGLPPGGSSTAHIYTQTIHRTTQNKQYIEQHKHFGRGRAVPRLCELYPGICLTTEEKARKNLSQGNRKVPAGTMKIHNHTIRLHRHNNKNTKITVLNRNATIYTLIKKIEPKEYERM